VTVSSVMVMGSPGQFEFLLFVRPAVPQPRSTVLGECLLAARCAIG
jgi:hypothetical protein